MDLSKIAGTVVLSLQLGTYLWPITIVVLVAGVWGIRSLVRGRKLGAWQTIVALGSMIFPLLVIPAHTVRFWADHEIHTPETQEMPLNLLMVGWAVFALVLAAAIAFARGFRLPLAGAASLVVWFAAGMYMVSVMAVSGVWL
jgi:hypothetical protein